MKTWTLLLKPCIIGIASILFLLAVMLNAARKAKTTKHKIYTYITTTGICGPLLVSFTSVLFDQTAYFFSLHYSLYSSVS